MEFDDVETWDVHRVIRWLDGLELSHYSPLFVKNNITGLVLLRFNYELELRNLGISTDHDRAKIGKAIDALRNLSLGTGQSELASVMLSLTKTTFPSSFASLPDINKLHSVTSNQSLLAKSLKSSKSNILHCSLPFFKNTIPFLTAIFDQGNLTSSKNLPRSTSLEQLAPTFPKRTIIGRLPWHKDKFSSHDLEQHIQLTASPFYQSLSLQAGQRQFSEVGPFIPNRKDSLRRSSSGHRKMSEPSIPHHIHNSVSNKRNDSDANSLSTTSNTKTRKALHVVIPSREISHLATSPINSGKTAKSHKSPREILNSTEQFFGYFGNSPRKEKEAKSSASLFSPNSLLSTKIRETKPKSDGASLHDTLEHLINVVFYKHRDCKTIDISDALTGESIRRLILSKFCIPESDRPFYKIFLREASGEIDIETPLDDAHFQEFAALHNNSKRSCLILGRAEDFRSMKTETSPNSFRLLVDQITEGTITKASTEQNDPFSPLRKSRSFADFQFKKSPQTAKSLGFSIHRKESEIELSEDDSMTICDSKSKSINNSIALEPPVDTKINQKEKYTPPRTPPVTWQTTPKIQPMPHISLTFERPTSEIIVDDLDSFFPDLPNEDRDELLTTTTTIRLPVQQADPPKELKRPVSSRSSKHQSLQREVQQKMKTRRESQNLLRKSVIQKKALATTTTTIRTEKKMEVADDSSPVVSSIIIFDDQSGFSKLSMRGPNALMADTDGDVDQWRERAARISKNSVLGLCVDATACLETKSPLDDNTPLPPPQLWGLPEDKNIQTSTNFETDSAVAVVDYIDDTGSGGQDRKSEFELELDFGSAFFVDVEDVKDCSKRSNLAVVLESRPSLSEKSCEVVAAEDTVRIKWSKGKLIGKGSFGKVYYGLNLVTNDIMAVKQVEFVGGKNVDNLTKKRMTDALYREISLLSELKHPAIVQFLGFI
ncbi:ATP binding [Nowakowskiella sp. JEL0078]|nr:ATP binding [Nowakowskiella sp. JEL0078]